MRRAAISIFILLGIFLIVQAAYSLHWPIAHDEAPLFYETFLMRSEGRFPYRDIFDFQMPGSYIAYNIIGILSNFSPLRIRIIDLALLAALIFITYRAMQSYGKITAITAGILFGLKYLQGGPSLSLQREYLILIFLSLILLVGMHDSLTPKHRLTLGLLFGLSAVIKPHAGSGLIPFLIFDIIDLIKHSNLTLLKASIKSLIPAAIGVAIPIILIGLWLALNHALTPFIDIAKNYWPLYAQINGQMEITTTDGRFSFLLSQLWKLGGNGLWLIPAAFGLYLKQNKQTYLLASLSFIYAIYPALSGQFFPYHYIPFTYFIILLASTSISTTNHQPIRTNSQPLTTHHSPPSLALPLSLLLLLIAIAITIKPSQTFLRQLEGKPIAIAADRAAELTRFLGKNLEPGDQVQPLDWTGGTLLAMLETRAPIATDYVFDFYFYHHISNPYIQSIRADFMTQLQASSPRFILEVTAIDKPWVSGEDTSRDFPELRAFLDEHYSITIQKDDYIIYELTNNQ